MAPKAGGNVIQLKRFAWSRQIVLFGLVSTVEMSDGQADATTVQWVQIAYIVSAFWVPVLSVTRSSSRQWTSAFSTPALQR